MNSDMSILTIDSSVPNINSASARTSSVLPTPVGPRKMNAPFGRRGSPRPARAAHRLGHGDHGFVLAFDPLAQRVFHLEQAAGLFLGDLHDRDARPHRHYLSDVLG